MTLHLHIIKAHRTTPTTTKQYQQTLISPFTMQDKTEGITNGIANINHNNNMVAGGITDNNHNRKTIVASVMINERREHQSKVSSINTTPNSNNKTSKPVIYQEKELEGIYKIEEAIKKALNEFNNSQPSPTIHDLSTKYNIPFSVLELYVTNDKSKRPLFEASVGHKQKQIKTKQVQETIHNEELVSIDKKTKAEHKRERDAKQKKWHRRQMHLKKQVNEHKNEENEKVQVWSGNVENGKWRTATKHSTFFDVIKIGKRKQKGEVMPNSAIMKFDGETDYEIVEERYCKKEEHCQAAQGNHPGAKYYCAMRVMTIQDMVCIKWPDRKKEEWLSKDQVKNPPPSSRSATNMRNYIDLTQIYTTIRRTDGVRDNNMQTFLPFSNLGEFLILIESNQKTVIRGNYAENIKKEDKKAKRKDVKCKDCNINQARRKGQRCNKCYKLKMMK